MSRFADLLPALPAEDYDALKADIAVRGVQVPVVVDEHGVIIDGAHRDRAARELGVDCPRVVRDGLDDEGKRALALALNLRRRHLTAEQRRPLVQALRDLGWSTRAIAREAGVDHSTVVRDLVRAGGASAPPAEAVPAVVAAAPPLLRLVSPRPGPVGTTEYLAPGTPMPVPVPAEPDPEPPTVVGRDGKKYPARRRAPEPDAAETRREEKHQVRLEATNTHQVIAAALRATRRINPDMFHDAIGRRAKVRENLTELRDWIDQALTPDAHGANQTPGANNHPESNP